MKQFPIKKIDAWWQAFRAHTTEIELFFQEKTQWNLWEWMIEELAKIHPDLVWEFGPGLSEGKQRLVITCEASRELRPLVRIIIDRAPRLPDWEFYPYRLAETFEDAKELVLARAGRDVSDMRFSATRNEINMIDLHFSSELFESADDSQGFTDAFTLTETMLGEEVLDHWIGVIALKHPAPETAESHPVSELKTVVDALIAEVKDALPSVPYYEMEEGSWTLYRLKPQRKEDYPWFDDVFRGAFLNMNIAKNIHGGRTFDSERFSKCGERFFCVKMERDDLQRGEDESEYQERLQRDRELGAALLQKKLGSIVGTCRGMRYFYIVFALTDVDAAFTLIRAFLQNKNVKRRSWFFPLDTDLQALYEGVWIDTPEMPHRKQA